MDGWFWKGDALEIQNVSSRTLGSAILDMGWAVVSVVWRNVNFCVDRAKQIVVIEGMAQEEKGTVWWRKRRGELRKSRACCRECWC